MSDAGRHTLHLSIHGRVQGVFYRDTMRREARRLGVAGWVRNRADGTVEAVVQGAPAAVDEIIRWVWQGPQHAEVTQVDVTPTDGTYSAFEIRLR